MAENTGKEQVENPVNTQPENSTDEIIPASDTGAVTANQPENMEVHTHSHATHGKKNWRDYFWEFLMLFLAVFCGFLAEYQLEHKIEKDRELQFIISLTTDFYLICTLILYTLPPEISWLKTG